MREKLELMRQKKTEYLQYQRQLAMQRMQEQERDMMLRQEQSRQQYHQVNITKIQSKFSLISWTVFSKSPIGNNSKNYEYQDWDEQFYSKWKHNNKCRMRAIITRSWILAIHKVRIFLRNVLKNKEIVFKNVVKNIQAAAYNGKRTVSYLLEWSKVLKSIRNHS